MTLTFGDSCLCDPHRCVHVARNLRDEGMARVEASTDAEWKKRATKWVYDLDPGSVFTAEAMCHWNGRPERPNAVGARLSALAKAGLIERVGFAQAERVERHAAWMSRWRRT